MPRKKIATAKSCRTGKKFAEVTILAKHTIGLLLLKKVLIL